MNITPSGPVTSVFTPAAVQAMLSSAVLTSSIARAQDSFKTLIDSQEQSVVSFTGYGSAFMKKNKISPDAYVQMAIQLATFRLFGKNVGTYEATQVRPFRHGRTETTRSCSTASVRFCEAMGAVPSPSLTSTAAKTRAALLRQAAAAHGAYVKKAAKAKGCDRHMFGLAMLLADDDHKPSLLSNPVYLRAKTWRVSTSHLTHSRFDNWGWGEVVPDGVGVAYSIHTNRCAFNVAARRDRNYSRPLGHYLEEALLEMEEVIEGEGGEGGRSRL